jgi:hypothetical protein
MLLDLLPTSFEALKQQFRRLRLHSATSIAGASVK